MEDASSSKKSSSPSPYRNSPSSLTPSSAASHRRTPSTGPTLNLPSISPSPSHARSRSTGNPTSTAAKFAMSLSIREDEEDAYNANDFDGYELVEFGPKSTNENEDEEDATVKEAAKEEPNPNSTQQSETSVKETIQIQVAAEATTSTVSIASSATSSSSSQSSQRSRRKRNACRKCKLPIGIYCDDCKKSFLAAKELLKGMKEKIKVCRRENRQLQKNINEHLKKTEAIRRKQQEVQLRKAKINAQKAQLNELQAALEHETVFRGAFQEEIMSSSKALGDAQMSFIQRRQYLDKSFSLQYDKENSKIVIDFSKELNRVSLLLDETERALFSERQRVCHELQRWLCVIPANGYPEHTRVFNQILPNNISDTPHVILAAELAAAFGNIVQFISYLCSYLDISLPYLLEFGASRSYIWERDESQKFPLFGKPKEVEQGMTRLCSNVEYMCFSEGLIINDRAMLLPNILGLLGSPSLGRPGLRGYHSILFYTPRNNTVQSASIPASASCSALAAPPPTPARKAASDSPSESSPSMTSSSSVISTSAPSNATPTPLTPLHSSMPMQPHQLQSNPQRSFSLFNIFKKEKEEKREKGKQMRVMNRSKDNIDQGWEIVDDDL